MHYNDKNYAWKNKDKVFGNTIVEFRTISLDGMDPGSKGSGRYGRKYAQSCRIKTLLIAGMV